MPRKVSLEPIGKVFDERIGMLQDALKDDGWTFKQKLHIKATIKTLKFSKAKIKAWCFPAALKLSRLPPSERSAAIWFIPGP